MSWKGSQERAVERRERLSTPEGRKEEAAFTARGTVLQQEDEERRRRGFIGKIVWYWSRRRKELLGGSPDRHHAMPPHETRMPAWSEKHLRAAIHAAGVALWSWNVDTDAITMDERAYDLWNVSKDEQKITFEILSTNIHPADLDRVRSAFAATRAVKGAYEIDFRILSGSDIRWISARGQGDDADIAERVLFGIFLDVTQRKQAEEANELLAGEMSHRVKNLLQIATSLTQITSRSAATKEQMAQDLTARLMALGRAQELVRPGPGQNHKATLLGDLVAVLLAPYDEQGATVRIRISVPKMNVGEASSTTLALVLHELATNSAKYGALSVPSGTLDVSCNAHDDDVVLMWTERGGPPVVAPAALEGFGSKLVHRSMAAQLGGAIAFDWSVEGVIVTLRMSRHRLTY
jgi:two-component sensor histidine kinase